MLFIAGISFSLDKLETYANRFVSAARWLQIKLLNEKWILPPLVKTHPTTIAFSLVHRNQFAAVWTERKLFNRCWLLEKKSCRLHNIFYLNTRSKATAVAAADDDNRQPDPWPGRVGHLRIRGYIYRTCARPDRNPGRAINDRYGVRETCQSAEKHREALIQ